MDHLFVQLENLNSQLIEESNARAESGDLTMRREVNAHIQGIYEDNRAGRMSDFMLRAHINAAREIQAKYQ